MGHSGVHHESSHRFIHVNYIAKILADLAFHTFLPRFLNDITSLDTTVYLLLFQNTQFPHTRRSPHNVQHSSS